MIIGIYLCKHCSNVVFQLRIRDLESALNIEKSANADASETIEKLNKQVR